MVVAVVILLTGRVLTVGHGTDRSGEGLSVFLIYRYDGRHLQRVLHRSAVHLCRIGDGEVLAHGDHLVEIPGGVQPGGDVLEAGVFQDSVHILVSQGEHGTVLVVGVREREVIVLRETSVGDGVHPVSVREGHGLPLVDISVVASGGRIGNGLAGCRVVGGDRNAVGGLEVHAVVAGIGHGVQSVVEGGLCHGGEIAAGVQQLHLRLAGIELCGEVGREVDGDLVAFLSLLRRDDDHTIRSA